MHSGAGDVPRYDAFDPEQQLWVAATLYDSATVSSEEVPGLIESWTLSCEKDGKVLEQVPVVVDRGQQVKADLRTCIARWKSA